MNDIKINRTIYNIMTAFPAIRDFPVLDTTDRSVAVLLRVFKITEDVEQHRALINMAIWNMRAHVLNSDIQNSRPAIIFHVEDSLFETAQPIFENAGVPLDSIIVFPDDVLGYAKTPPHVLYKAAAPFLDPQLERFEHVIVLDADSFSLSNDETGLVPLMDISLNHMPSDHVSLLRGWEARPFVDYDYRFWYIPIDGRKEGWIRRAAKHCDTTPEIVENILYPADAETTPRPYHNGTYINIPMRCLRNNPGFRSFIHEVNGTMGNEEVAMAVWCIKHYLETGERLPRRNLVEFAYKEPSLTVHWDMTSGWKFIHKKVRPTFVHIHGFESLDVYAYEFAKTVHASDVEADQFANTVTRDFKKLREGQQLYDINGSRIYD